MCALLHNDPCRWTCAPDHVCSDTRHLDGMASIRCAANTREPLGHGRQMCMRKSSLDCGSSSAGLALHCCIARHTMHVSVVLQLESCSTIAACNGNCMACAWRFMAEGYASSIHADRQHCSVCTRCAASASSHLWVHNLLHDCIVLIRQWLHTSARTTITCSASSTVSQYRSLKAPHPCTWGTQHPSAAQCSPSTRTGGRKAEAPHLHWPPSR